MSIWEKMKLKKIKTLGKMPIEKPKRELKEVIAEYGDIAANIGDRKYRIALLEREIEEFYYKADKTQAEAKELQKDIALQQKETKQESVSTPEKTAEPTTTTQAQTAH